MRTSMTFQPGPLSATSRRAAMKWSDAKAASVGYKGDKWKAMNATSKGQFIYGEQVYHPFLSRETTMTVRNK